MIQTSHAPSSVTSPYEASSSQRVAWFIVAAVALNTIASTATIPIATAAWISADASASSAPLRAVWRLASTYEEITALPCPGPSAWKIP
ncbi:hypothetical protein D3C72_1927610 [compost metagenome]